MGMEKFIACFCCACCFFVFCLCMSMYFCMLIKLKSISSKDVFMFFRALKSSNNVLKDVEEVGLKKHKY